MMPIACAEWAAEGAFPELTELSLSGNSLDCSLLNGWPGNLLELEVLRINNAGLDGNIPTGLQKCWR